MNTVDITSEGGIAPVAALTADKTSGEVPLKVSFDGRESSDEDGQVLIHQWDFGDGSRATGPEVVHTFNFAGNYTVQMTVIDNDNIAVSAQIEVSAVQDGVIPPIAAIEYSPSAGLAPLEVSFDGSGSDPRGGEILSYNWNFGDGESGEGATTTHTFTTPGTYNVVLSVQNTAMAIDSISVEILVRDGTPHNLPGLIEVEDFREGPAGEAYNDTSDGNDPGDYRGGDVDIRADGDVSNGHFIRGIESGEWLAYDVNVTDPGDYRFSVWAGLDGGNKSMHFEVDGENVTGPMDFDFDAGFTNFLEVRAPMAVPLTAGQHEIRLYFDDDAFTVDYILGSREEGDPCDVLTCDQPSPNCSGTIRRTYSGAGVCMDGACDFGAVVTEMDCADAGQACANGVCEDSTDPCITETCEPPSAFCTGATTLTRYTGNGTCDSSDGSCDYAGVQMDATCPDDEVCSNGVCAPDSVDLCMDVTCDSPPADACDGTVAVTYAGNGTCMPADGSCDYSGAEARNDCDPDSCMDGACVTVDLCMGVTCMPPADYCDANNAVTYSGAGTCMPADGSCDYSGVMASTDCDAMTCTDGVCL